MAKKDALVKKTPNVRLAKSKKRKQQIGKFFKDVLNELKKVSWPSRKQLLNTTAIVLGFIILLAIVIGIFDFGLGQLLGLLV